MSSAYPLVWPVGVPRTEPNRRKSSPFKTGLPAALKNVRGSLNLFGVDTGKPVSNIVLSSNVTLGAEKPADPGIAVWFVWDGKERCIAVDRYPKVEDNLQAIHHILEARRTEMRHGGLHIVQQTFAGFIALPSPDMIGDKTCWQILDIPPGASVDRINEAHRALIKQVHPDKTGGTMDDSATLNAARDAALAQVGAR